MDRSGALSAQDEMALASAIATLETHNLAARLADIAGAPFTRAMRALPKFATQRIDRAVERAIHDALGIAIETLDGAPKSGPAVARSTLLAGVAGGVGGLFGLLSLPIELPITTTIMLRAIADIARHEGEDLHQLETRLACLEVFALSASGGEARSNIGYFAARAMMTKLTADAAAYVLERGVTNLAAPAINSLVTAIVARFSAVVSERLAASALPIAGSIGGAAINMIFMSHFQAIASAHFTIRRLERAYGGAAVERRYRVISRIPNNLNAAPKSD